MTDGRRIAIGLLCCACCGREAPPGAAAQAAAQADARPAAQQPAAPASKVPATARLDVYEGLRADLAAPRHPADGGGRAWLESEEDASTPAAAGAPGRWTLQYEAGPLGVAEGGAVYLQVSPFWGWSTPQVEDPERPGYTTVSTEAQGVRLAARSLDAQLLGIELQGRRLAPGERLRIVYGAGPAGAYADRFAEADSRFWFAVDGDGDGVRKVLADSPGVPVAPGPPARLLLTLPSTARPGSAVRLTVALLDADGNAGVDAAGEVRLDVIGEGLLAPPAITLDAGGGGRKTIELMAQQEGLFRVLAEGPGGLLAESNPLLVAADAPRVLWGDLQIHSALSDGTGRLDDVYAYARDVAALDVAAVTDHDHWGMLFLDQHPQSWQEVQDAAARYHEPGRLVTLPGYEWTSWIHGHRHVLYFGDSGRLYSSMDERYDTPPELWEALRGQDALTLAHHSAGSAIATDWSIAPDPRLEPVTEIVSVHGSSEAPDSPRRIRGAVPGNYVRDALGRGYRLGFLGSSDGHDGHPGLGHLASSCGGLAAILSEECTRAGVLEALRARRCYATSGARILLRTSLGGARMGASLPASEAARELVISVVGTAPIERVDIVRSGAVAASLAGDGARVFSARRPLEGLQSGESVYVRVVQADQHAAWSSPFYVE
ncbi:MAG: DUF3604 domain-containing protein [Planctomycetota bacterium]|nr:MAG: DUF3604 domain-containing protein [Planctomycetota bacterium]